MANVFDGIDDQLRGWIARQRLFFVGTSPLAGESIDGLPALEV
jgi:hypothetical protein